MLIRLIRAKKYDLILNLQRFLATGLITVFSGAGKTFGFNKNPLSFLFSKKIKHQVGGANSIHETERNLQLIREFTNEVTYKPKLYPTPEDYHYTLDLSIVKFITISPASVWFTKQYPISQWISFIRNIPAGYAIYLLGGPDDIALCETIRKTCSHPDLKVLTGTLTFLQSAALMSKAIMNYVNDSAPMHFASAMNAPVTAIYCSTIPEFGFGPLSDNSHIVQIEDALYCRPCGLHGFPSCPEKHFRCAMNIRTQQLMRTLPK